VGLFYFVSPRIRAKDRILQTKLSISAVAYPRIFFLGGSTNSVEDRKNGNLGAVAPLVRCSGGICNLVQEISFNIVKSS